MPFEYKYSMVSGLGAASPACFEGSAAQRPAGSVGPKRSRRLLPRRAPEPGSMAGPLRSLRALRFSCNVQDESKKAAWGKGVAFRSPRRSLRPRLLASEATAPSNAGQDKKTDRPASAGITTRAAGHLAPLNVSCMICSHLAGRRAISILSDPVILGAFAPCGAENSDHATASSTAKGVSEWNTCARSTSRP
jgi:hypothetical protein